MRLEREGGDGHVLSLENEGAGVVVLESDGDAVGLTRDELAWLVRCAGPALLCELPSPHATRATRHLYPTLAEGTRA